MPISSYVIRCAPVDQPAVQDRLRALPGVALGEPMAAGIPVVTDTPTTRAAEELGAQLEQVPGVKAAILVYHNFEDVADDAAPLPNSFRTS